MFLDLDVEMTGFRETEEALPRMIYEDEESSNPTDEESVGE